MEIPKKIKYNGRFIQNITSKEAKGFGLVKVGSASAESISHSLYLLNRYCKYESKVSFFSVDYFVSKEDSDDGRGTITFWMEKE